MQQTETLLLEIEELKTRLAEAERQIDAIKAGEADVFAFHTNDQPEVLTLQSGDYAYRVLVENFSEGALNLSEEGLIVYSNSSFYETLHLTYEDVIGKSIFPFIHPGSQETFNQLFKKGLTGQSKGEINLIAGQQIIPVYVSLTSLSPRLPTVGMVVTDLSEKKQAEKELEAKEMLQHVFIQAPFALAVYEGKDFVVSLANELCCNIIGKTESEVIGRKLFDLFPETAAQGFDKILGDIYATGKPFYGNEFPLFFLKNGKDFHGYFDFVYQPILDAQNNVTGVISIAIDVTDKVATRSKIEESEKKYRALFNSIDEGFCTIDVLFDEKGKPYDYRFLETNIAFEKQTGFTNAVGKTMNDFAQIEDFWYETYGNVAASGEAIRFENGAENLHRFYDVYAFKTGTADERKVGVLFTNITERKKTEVALKESEERFRLLADESPLFIFIVESDVPAPVSYWNKTWLVYTGQTVEQALGRAWDGIIHPDDVQHVMDIYISAFKSRRPYLVPAARTLRHDGEYRWHSFKSNPRYLPNGEFNGYIGVGFDIHEQKLAEEAVKVSQQEYQALIHNLPSAVGILKGADFTITTANEAIIKIWSKGSDVIGKKYFELLPELSEQGFNEVFTQVYTTGIPFNAIEMPVDIIREGKTSKSYYNFTLYPQKNIKNEVDGIGIIATEVTSQALFNLQIKESQEQFSAMADNISQFAWMMDNQGWIYWYNQRWYDFTGTTLGEMQGWGWQKVHHPDMIDGVTARFKEAIDRGVDWEDTFLLRAKDGSYQWFLSRATPIKDASGNILRWFGTNTNIEKEKAHALELENAVQQRTQALTVANQSLEQSNIELQRMNKELEAFTYISSHDLQEPLRKIQTFAGRIIATEKDQLSEKAKGYLSRMDNAAARMQTLIKDLLSFSRLANTDRNFEITDLRSIIDDVKGELNERIVEKNATIVAVKLCEIKVIPFQFRQLMYNLMGNALKFSRPGVSPVITIESTIANGSQLNNGRLVPDKSYCHISIADNGIGFEPKFSERIFEVFQQLHSKEKYGGTGIGLAIVKKIVDYHSGIITVDSYLGRGTRFDIYIPA